jgi:hypothetical protein
MDQNGSKHADKGLEVQYSLHSTVEVKRTYGKCIIYPSIHLSIHASVTAQQYAFLILLTLLSHLLSISPTNVQCRSLGPHTPHETSLQPVGVR